MKPLFNLEKIESYKPSENLPFECKTCKCIFYRQAKYVCNHLKSKNPRTCPTFCSLNCSNNSKNTKIATSCGQCGKEIVIRELIIKQSKSGEVFCSKSCACTYNNTHKAFGNRRSKLEIWLESKISEQFPTLKAIYNNKDIINSELDIYFPTLKLAIELNGIFHYEPIYGQEKLNSIQNNDHRKFQACLEMGIELVIVDSSSLKVLQAPKRRKIFHDNKKHITY